MGSSDRWNLSRERQQELIHSLESELVAIRARIGISQGELAYLIGVSRQTYSAIECAKKDMSWNTYLALIWFFDNNVFTHNTLRQLGIFPEALVDQFNGGKPIRSNYETDLHGKWMELNAMLDGLDEMGLHTVKTVLRMESERCQENQS